MSSPAFFDAEGDRQNYYTRFFILVKYQMVCYNELMHTSLLLIHIVAMIASLGLMSTAIATALFGKKVAVRIATIGLLTTVTGFVTGTVLLLQAPVLSRCAILTAYLVAVIAVYGYGFGWGNATKAIFLRDRF